VNILPFHISPLALDELKSIIQAKKIPTGYGVRIGIKGSGCAGVNFIIGFDECAADDKTFEHEGVFFYISKKHLLYVSDLHVDFINTLEERGFIFEHQAF
jgi:iron-sulfur cluster assembly protein